MIDAINRNTYKGTYADAVDEWALIMNDSLNVRGVIDYELASSYVSTPGQFSLVDKFLPNRY